MTFPALITFDRVNSLPIIAVLAEWADHSIRTTVIAAYATASGSNRAGTPLTTSFPDVLTPGTHKIFPHQLLFLFLLLTQNVISPCFLFLEEFLFFFEKVFVRLL